MATNIQTVADRKKPDPQPAPCFARLEQGAFIGYRKLTDGTGKWIACWRDEQSNRSITRSAYSTACDCAIILGLPYFDGTKKFAARCSDYPEVLTDIGLYAHTNGSQLRGIA